MKTTFPLLIFVFSLLPFPAGAMIATSVRFGVEDAILTGFNDYQTDATPDSTTVRFTLADNPSEKRWEFRLSKSLTGSRDLTAGSDVTIGTDVQLQFQKYPNGDAQGVRWIYLQGVDLQDIAYSDATDTIDLKVRPVAPARTVNHPGSYTAALGIDFYYKGTPSAPIAYSPPIIAGDVFPEEIEAPQHPSSALLWGKALRVDGIQGEQVWFDYLFGSSFGNAWNFDINTTGGFLDGVVPPNGFSASAPSTPSFSVNMGIPSETFITITLKNINFSAHDIQAGVFRPAPQFTDIQREQGGIRVFWNADTNRVYTLESFSNLGTTPNVVATNLSGPNFLDTTIGTSPARYYRLREQ